MDGIVAEIVQQPQGLDILISREFDAYLSSPDGHKHDEAISAVEGLEDRAAHFIHRHSLWTR